MDTLSFLSSACWLAMRTIPQVMTKRILARGVNSGRIDDNEEAIRKRLVTYRESTMPIIREFEERAKLRQVNSDQTVGEKSGAVASGIRRCVSLLAMSPPLRFLRAWVQSQWERGDEIELKYFSLLLLHIGYATSSRPATRPARVSWYDEALF